MTTDSQQILTIRRKEGDESKKRRGKKEKEILQGVTLVSGSKEKFFSTLLW